ncbi:hypothetical protein [Rubellimicrobium roseum]|uniref:DUF560 domain-containing protein n=1 Tax=Rubellimicrobium roseum TaxID=687525 RepID=A0A5C4NCI3_9RHOB|nr:hypothetical protein [Rubellimicrobium roseum]TNC71615.1 hypothetical protein FHG71_10580 [Rubellimicrobium roseum]
MRIKTLAAVLALAWGGMAAAQPARLDMTLPEARAIARQAVLSGDAALAREIAAGLLAGNPDDRAALVVLASAEPALGRPAQGRLAAARAWRLSRTDAQRHEAARLAAAAALAERRFFLAEFWLRRALNVAPDAEQEARTRRDAGRVRTLNPWRVDVELSFAPSDNVNGGSESAFNLVDGLPFVGVISVDGRALAGYEGTLDLRVSRRLSESERQRTVLSVRAYARGVALSQEAKDLIEQETDPGDPPITGADFAFRSVELRLRQDRALAGARVGADLSLGSTWSGDELYRRTLRLAGDASRPLGEGRQVRVSGFVEPRWDDDGDRAELRLGAEGAWSTRAFGRDRLTLALSRGQVRSDNVNAAQTSWGARASYDLGRAVGPARLGVDVRALWSDYEDYAVVFPVPGGRQDRTLSVTLEAAFAAWDYAGFIPVATLEASRTESNVGRFDSDNLGLGVAIRSTF